MEIGTNQILIAFALTTFAGLATGIGSALAFFSRTTNKSFLAGALGFSAGVMLYISFAEMLVEAKEQLATAHGADLGAWLAVIAFLGGFAISLLIDQLIPSYENPHELRGVEEMDQPRDNAKLQRLGVVTAVAIALHNFPEGLAVFAASLKDTSLGIPIALAVAIHNIPEGIAVAVPIYYATGSRKKAFWYSLGSGLSEPLGALVGFLFLRPFLTDSMFGLVFALIAGIMVYISLDELLPTAQRYDKGHHAIIGLGAGMAVMAISLILLH